MKDLESWMYVNAGPLFRNAVELCSGLASLTPNQQRRDALVTIVLASISMEAFINELHHQAVHHSVPDAPGWVNALGDLLGEAEESHASIESKYQLAKFILSGQTFDKGVAPYQDFALLVEVRNLIVHLKPAAAMVRKGDNGELMWSAPRTMTRLQRAGIIKVDEHLKRVATRHGCESIVTDLLSQIGKPEVGSWACRSVAGIVAGVLDSVEAGPLRAALEATCREDFRIEPAPGCA